MILRKNKQKNKTKQKKTREVWKRNRLTLRVTKAFPTRWCPRGGGALGSHFPGRIL